ncbi:MAG TPA: hypothetical protein VLZ81_11775 [Blastocatellia bacterium]|nr:hypothetical protein [Blastocatellia bacterium]
MTSLQARLAASIIACFLGWFLVGFTTNAWRNYWLLKDAQQGVAVVARDLGHGAVEYRYAVNGVEYTGRSGRDWWPPYDRVGPGEKAAVYFSASHPELSQLYMPPAVIEGLPVVLIVLIFETFAAVTIINPKSGWAFDFSGKRRADDE